MEFDVRKRRGLHVGIDPADRRRGDPFGGDDTGCVPPDKIGDLCGAKIALALAKLNANVIKCHLIQAGSAFKTRHSSPGFDNAEEHGEIGPSNTSAKAKFDNLVAKYAPVCDPALIAAAQAREGVILDDTNPDSLDALSASFFCDNSSGLTIAEPGGDDTGSIPADAGGFKCSGTLAKAYSKLLVAVSKCHIKAAHYGLGARPFDEDACEDAPLPANSARVKYDAVIAKLNALGVCPACVLSNAPTLADDVIGDLDSTNMEIYPCPGP